MAPISELPPASEAVGLTAWVAAVMSEVARTEYSPAALHAMDVENSRIGTDDVPDPATLPHQFAGHYLITAGDFICGMQYVINPDANLFFSSAALARSACEFSNRASWLAEPGIPTGERIARAVGIIRNTVDNETALLEPTDLAAVQELSQTVERWWRNSDLGRKIGRPDPTRLFITVSPTSGEVDYKRLCNATHGSFLTVAAGHHAASTGAPMSALDAWWRAVTACRYGLEAAWRVTSLQGNVAAENLQDATNAYVHYNDLCVRWEDSQ